MARVLIVSQYFWPEPFRINDLAAGLVEKGYQVTVLTARPNYPGGRLYKGYGWFNRAREQYLGVDIIRVPLVPRGRGSGLRLVINYLSYVLFACLLGPLRCRGHFDLIFVYEPSPITVGLPALLMKKLKRAPLMFWVQDLWPESLAATGAVRSTWILKQVEQLVHFIYRGCDRILVQSKAFVDPIRKLGVDSERIQYFPNSAEALYRPVTVHAGDIEQSDLPAGFRVMFAGNIGAAQDFSTILEAAERIREHTDIHWIILGEGRMYTWVREQIRLRGLSQNVHLLGRHPVESMPRFFAMADVMLVTLCREPIFSLTIPAKLQSYLACGRPLIAALEGEGANVVREAGAGLTPAPEDPAALAGAVLSMYRMDKPQREQLGNNGRRYFETHFERGILLNRLDGWMKELHEGLSPCVS